MNIKEIAKMFKKRCFSVSESRLVPLHTDQTEKEKYIVKKGETLQSVSEKIQKGEGEFSGIAQGLKELDKNRYEYSWQYMAEYNYGTTQPSVINWMMCELHDFDKTLNITSDKKNYKYKGGEILYYPTKFKRAKTGKKAAYVMTDDTPGLILHPSFLCPALVGTDSMLSILVMGNPEKPAITPEKVNLHLKILPWDEKIGEIKHSMLQGSKYDGFVKSLFGSMEEARKNISCEKMDFSEVIEDSNGRFCFLADQKVMKTYNDYGYKDLYRIEIHLKYLPMGSDYLNEGYYNLFWINCDREREDEIIQRKMNYFFGDKIFKSGNDKWYGFAVETKSLFFGKLQPRYPIASYHPVYYKKKKYFNMANLADLHIASRFTLMKRCQAKVIEADDIPTIGSMMNDHYETAYDLFNQAGTDKDVDIVTISGDIIDYIKSFYPVAYVDKRNELLEKGEYGFLSELKLEKFYENVGSIWEAVGVEDKDETNKKYQDYVDLITIYSIILNFYQTHKKPTYFVTGNHDAYYYPYGVSPRVPLYGKANPGIPADINLTIYEAILSYGDKYGKIIKGVTEPSLQKGNFETLYSLFTPMKDFALIMPDFSLIGLSWGLDEDIIDLAGKIPIIGPIIGDDGQGIGHLPRADDAISDNQLEKIFEFALKKNKSRNILMSHFTFVSYEEGISFKSFEEGDVEFDWHWEASKYDMGTFETNRKKIYEEYLYKKKKPDYILTGHSHRRGLYEITNVDYAGDNSVKARYYGFSHHNRINGTKIIVSDSGGPIPRYNYDGEFAGWGSTSPSFTKMIFQDDGNLSELKPVVTKNASAKPRFAVALDYLYIIKDCNIIGSFNSENLGKWEYLKSTKLEFRLKWNTDIFDDEKSRKYIDISSLDIDNMAIYYHYDDQFHKVPLYTAKISSSNEIKCQIDFGQKSKAEHFRKYACKFGVRTVYASMVFKRMGGPQYGHYNFASPYNFEIEIKEHKKDGKIHLSVTRDKDKNEIPDLTWRKENYAKKYQYKKQ